MTINYLMQLINFYPKILSQKMSNIFFNKNRICLFLIFFLFTFYGKSQNNKNGEQLFLNKCGSCHGIATGSFGPKLGGVHGTRPLADLYQFVRNPSKYIKNNDFRTKLLLEKYKTEMPAFAYLKEKELFDIFDYIKKQTIIEKVEALSTNSLLSNSNGKRYAKPIKSSKLYIELEPVVKIPIQKNVPDDKGIATLRVVSSMAKTLFVSDQMGLIYLVKDNLSSVYFDIRQHKEKFVFSPGIGTGLGSFDFHPDFENNGLFYTTHAEKYVDKPAINDGDWPDSLGVGLQWIITEWKAEIPNSPIFNGKSREVLRFNTPTTAHGGQDLAFEPDLPKTNPNYGLLFLGIGDGGSNNLKMPELGHKPQSILGTILRIDPAGSNGIFKSYGIPSDNPFANNMENNIQKEIYAMGFRNPHRFAWKANDFIVADIGESNIEEVNLVVKGGDYGWPEQEGSYGISTKIDKTYIYDLPVDTKSAFLSPTAQYDHNDGNAISGGFFYKGNLKALHNKYIFGDIVNGRLFYIDFANRNALDEINDINIIENGKETSLRNLVKQKRVHLRIGFDQYSNELFVLTKADNTVRKVKKAYFK
jgi:cytochrome c2